jgi:hypothetical protein
LKAKRAIDESDGIISTSCPSETGSKIISIFEKQSSSLISPVVFDTSLGKHAKAPSPGSAKRRKRQSNLDVHGKPFKDLNNLHKSKKKAGSKSSHGSVDRSVAMVSAAVSPETLTKKIMPPVLGIPSLCEYPEWSMRRSSCNLIVVVEGIQFNLHQFPMLIACPELRNKLKQQQSQDQHYTDKCHASTSSPPIKSRVAVLKYAHFPGGFAAFELACIYAYTGQMDIHASNVALLYCAARILKMHVALTSRCATLLETLAHSGTGMDVVHMLLQVVEIRKCLRNQSTDRMMALCVNAISARYPFASDTMEAIVKLPCDVFLHITQLILNDKPNATVNNVVARLCAQAHLAQVFRSVQRPREKAMELIKVLDILMTLDNQPYHHNGSSLGHHALENEIEMVDPEEDTSAEEGEIKEENKTPIVSPASAFAPMCYQKQPAPMNVVAA